MAEPIHRNSLEPGHRLQGYRIGKVLGQGGFGITYLAHDSKLDQEVAIKEYLPIDLAVRERNLVVQPAADVHRERFQWGLDRFISEARTLARFKHPNIVRVLTMFEANGTGYMVMEYEEGETLTEKLSRRQTLEEDELMNIVLPILGGLEKVHERSFIHRDIKPANIFIRKDGSPVLIDFGSARQAVGAELTTLVSPGYAPIEQYHRNGEQQGPWTDIYGLGATLYRAVTGQPPHDALQRSQALHEGARDSLVGAGEIGKGRYSAPFLKAIDHALQFRQNDRPQSVAEWRREFGAAPDVQAKVGDSAMMGTTIPADEPPGGSRIQPVPPTVPARRRGLALALLAAAVVAPAFWAYRNPTAISDWLVPTKVSPGVPSASVVFYVGDRQRPLTRIASPVVVANVFYDGFAKPVVSIDWGEGKSWQQAPSQPGKLTFLMNTYEESGEKEIKFRVVEANSNLSIEKSARIIVERAALPNQSAP